MLKKIIETKNNKLDGSSSTQTSKPKDEITLLAKAWTKQLSPLLTYLKLNHCKDLDKIFVSSIKCPCKGKDVLLSHKTE